MPKKVGLFLLFFVVAMTVPDGVLAFTCSYTAIDNQMDGSGYETFSVSVENDDSADGMKWFRAENVDGDGSVMQLLAASFSGFSSSSLTATSVEFTGGNLPYYGIETMVFSLAVPPTLTGEVEQWNIYASEQSNGSGAVLCLDGSEEDIPITVNVPNPNRPYISGWSVTPSDVSAQITWNTDIAASSVVNYGLDSGYGMSESEVGLVTSHSLTLTGLIPETVYHYQLNGTAGAGGSSPTFDATFTTTSLGAGPSPSPTDTPSPSSTPAPSVTVTPTPTPSTLVAVVTATPTPAGALAPTQTPTPLPAPTPIPDIILPEVTILTEVREPVVEAFAIEGEAGDNKGVRLVEYSIDGGENWLPVDEVEGLGTGQAKYAFVPDLRLDGNYQIFVRVTDLAGNTDLSGAYEVVIDRLPPLLVAGVMASGPWLMEAGDDGWVTLVEGSDPVMVVSSVGGAIQVGVRVQEKGQNEVGEVFALEEHIESGVWKGQVVFDQPGEFELLAESLDGAGNRIEKKLQQVRVVESGRVVGGSDVGLVEARLSVYVYEPVLGRFVLWSGREFGQQNPQVTNDQGKYSLLLPVGRYYLEVEAEGYVRGVSRIFQVNNDRPLAVDLKMVEKSGWGLMPIVGDLQQTRLVVELGNEAVSLVDSDLIGSELPAFSFDSEQGQIHADSLKGGVAVLSFISSWLPDVAEQIQLVEGKEEIESMVVLVQETDAAAAAYKARGGYEGKFVGDELGLVADLIGVESLPTHIVLDRSGVVKKVIRGELSEEQLVIEEGD